MNIYIDIKILISIAALIISAIGIVVKIYPLLKDRKNKRILKEAFELGPYDMQTIINSTKYYIKPKCSNIDPAQEQEPRHALMATREDLFEKVDQFMYSDQSKKHLLLLADSGTGKTSFLLNYYAYNLKKRKKSKINISLIPLGIRDADGLIEDIPNKKDRAIFLDAFDEDIKASVDHKARIRELVLLCKDFKRLVMTSRTQFFLKDEEIPVETGVVKIGIQDLGEKKEYEFWKLYLSPFSDKEIDKYVRKRYPIWKHYKRKKAKKIISLIPMLSVRPMLLAHIPDLIKNDAKYMHAYELYEIMINAWIYREVSRSDSSEKLLRRLSELLAVDMYTQREKRGVEQVSPNEIMSLSRELSINISGYNFTGRSLLNRDALGNYKFAHRSIMEYLIAYSIFKGCYECYGMLLTDQIKLFLCELFDIYDQNVVKYILRHDLIAFGLNDDESINKISSISKIKKNHAIIKNIMLIKVAFDSIRKNMEINYIAENKYDQEINDDDYIENDKYDKKNISKDEYILYGMRKDGIKPVYANKKVLIFKDINEKSRSIMLFSV